MKYLLAVSLLACLCGSAWAQYAWNSNKEVVRGIYPSNSNVSPVLLRASAPWPVAKLPGVRMRDAGIALIVGGTISLVIGVALLSSANYNFTAINSNGSANQVDPKFTYGVVFAAEGTGLLITGIVFASIGSKKLRRYQSQQKVSLNLRGAGAVLRFRF